MEPLLWDTSIHGTLARSRWYVLNASSIVLWHRVIVGCVLQHTFTNEWDKTATSWTFATNIPLEIFSLWNNFPGQYPKKRRVNMLDFSHLPGPVFDPSRQENSFGVDVRAPAFCWTAAGNLAYGENSLHSMQKFWGPCHAFLPQSSLCLFFVLLGRFPYFSRACIPSSRESSCCCKLGKWELPHRQGELYRWAD